MESSIQLIVHRSSVTFDSVIVTPFFAIRCEQGVKQEEFKQQKHVNSNSFIQNKKVGLIRLNKKGYNSYLISGYISMLIQSYIYRRAALEKLLNFFACKFPDRVDEQIIFVRLRTPKKQFLDYKWSERITQMTLERREVDHAMSWLSTLGGAFSALGEEFQHCAEMAGKISVKQFELALRLGDPLLVARCKLYAALSSIQQGELKAPRKVVKNIYRLAIAQKDVRLQNMCQGIWAKLKYCYKMKREQNRVLQL